MTGAGCADPPVVQENLPGCHTPALLTKSAQTVEKKRDDFSESAEECAKSVELIEKKRDEENRVHRAVTGTKAEDTGKKSGGTGERRRATRGAALRAPGRGRVERKVMGIF